MRFIFSLKSVFVCFVAILFVSNACAPKKESKRLSVQSSVMVEAAFFRSNCVLCHGKEADGGKIGERIVPSLREGDAAKKSDEELYNQIYNGGNGMPPFKYQLTEPQIRNLVRFIRDLQKTDY